MCLLQWANHDCSLKLEEDTKKKMMSRIEKKVANGEGTWIDWQYLLDAVALLKKVRVSIGEMVGVTQVY